MLKKLLLITFLVLMNKAVFTETIYVSNEKDHNITVIDGESLEVIKTVKVGHRPRGIILSRDKKELYEIFNLKVPKELKNKCKFILDMNTNQQTKIFGLQDNNLKNALDRKYTIPFLFEGNKIEKNKLLKILRSSSLNIQDGGRVLNLGDNTDKVKSMNQVLKIYKKVENKIKVICVGDNFNDLDMLKNCDIPCLVFNDQFKRDQINIDNLIVSNKPSPEGWSDVIKTALVKLSYKD